MAATTRPQLGSSPATAVLTKGELAMAKAWVLASASDFCAGHMDLNKFCRPFAVAHNLMGQIEHHLI